MAACQTCHADSHKAQKILFLGKGGKGIPHPMPNIMLEKSLSCKGWPYRRFLSTILAKDPPTLLYGLQMDRNRRLTT